MAARQERRRDGYCRLGRLWRIQAISHGGLGVDIPQEQRRLRPRPQHRRQVMSQEEVERIDDQGMAAWDRHDADTVAALLADDFAWTDVTLPEPMRTKDQARQYAQAWFTAFPDMRVRQTNRIVSD